MTQELKRIEFENTSLFTKAQQYTMAKLASHFRIPQKMMRQAVDEGYLAENQLSFPMFCSTFNERFYPIQKAFKGADLLNSKAFLKSDLKVQIEVGLDTGATVVLLSGTVPWVMSSYYNFNRSEGVGGIYMKYPEFGEYIVLPKAAYLQNQYPPPPG